MPPVMISNTPNEPLSKALKVDISIFKSSIVIYVFTTPNVLTFTADIFEFFIVI